MNNNRIIENSHLIASRLREERNRLNITQEKMASLFPVSPGTVSQWEKECIIPADKLALLISIGFDVQYILSGVYSVNMDQIGLHHGEAKPLSNAGENIHQQEQEFLSSFRELNDIEKKHILLFMSALTKNA